MHGRAETFTEAVASVASMVATPLHTNTTLFSSESILLQINLCSNIPSTIATSYFLQPFHCLTKSLVSRKKCWIWIDSARGAPTTALILYGYDTKGQIVSKTNSIHNRKAQKLLAEPRTTQTLG